MSKNKQCISVRMCLKRIIADICHILDNYFIYQQDGAPAHHRHHVTQLLDLHCHYVLEFIELENCPSNSPELSLVIF